VIPHVSASDIELGITHLTMNGVVIIDDLIDHDTVDQILAELEPHLAATRPGGGAFYGGQAKRVSAVIAKAPTFSSVLVNSTLLQITDAILKANCNRYIVTLTAALEVWPNGELQPLHRDEEHYGKYLDYSPEAPEYLVSFMVAGTEFTADNGATRLVPESHLWQTDRVADESETMQAAMSKGSVAIWLGSVIHGMDINRTAVPRTGIVGGFCLGWLRQEENQYLACPPEIAQHLPDDVQGLLGYRQHTSLLGWAGGRDHKVQTRPASEVADGQ
jgi:ectoine hydroxylase-related dioxygenase (phytanoyl-CoA dioxygenase family)